MVASPLASKSTVAPDTLEMAGAVWSAMVMTPEVELAFPAASVTRK